MSVDMHGRVSASSGASTFFASHGGAFAIGGLFVLPVALAFLAVLGAERFVLVVCAVLALASMVVILWRPHLGVLFVVVLVYSNAVVIAVNQHGIPSVAAAIVPILLVIGLFDSLARGHSVILPPAAGWLLAYSVVIFISAAVSSDPFRAFDEVGTFVVEGLGIYVGVTNVIRTRAVLMNASKVLVIVASVIALLSIFQWATGSFDNNFGGFAQVSDDLIKVEDGTNTQPRIAGSVGEKNRHAQIMGVVLPLAMAMVWIAKRRLHRVLWSICGLSLLVSIGLTYSRGAAVGLLPILLLMPLLRGVRLRNVAAIALTVGAMFLAIPGYGERIATIANVSGATADLGEQGDTDTAIRGRAAQNLTAIYIALDHPLFGVGPGMYPAYYREYVDDVGIRPRQKEREAHSLPLGILADTGLLGLFAFSGFVGTIVAALWRIHRTGDLLATGYFLGVLAYLTTGMFLHLAYARYFWLVISLAAVVVAIRDVPSHPSLPKTSYA